MIYKNNTLKEISYPLGGIGTGSIGIAGNGTFIDFEIFNRPNKGGMVGFTFFAIRAEYPNGKVVTKVLQGDQTTSLTGTYKQTIFSGFGYGPSRESMCSFPHFKNVEFDGRFPLAKLTFTDDNFPASVEMTAFNPLIPLDADNSSIPAAFFNIKVNSFEDNVNYTVVFSAKNPFKSTRNFEIKDGFTGVQLKCADVDTEDKEYGDITIAVNREDADSQEYWYRGDWMDPITVFWHELTNNDLHERKYDTAAKDDIASIGATDTLSKNGSAEYKFIYAWNVPNNYNYWSPLKDDNGNDVTWKNYYATLFADSVATAKYSINNWDMLYSKTEDFCNTLHNSSLDPAVIDAASSTLSVLKSSTTLRFTDGTFYGWEGVHEKEGSCEGTCTHVWSYAYALCFLFPQLERSIRNTEFKYDTDEYGNMCFRTLLPLGRGKGSTRACVDGQMASVFKTYREWKISGDTEWLKTTWPSVKLVLEHAWSEHNVDEWDRDKDGVLEGRQHHTLDMEIFGPSSWLQGMYLAALKAAAEMAEFLGEHDKAAEYTDLFDKGYAYTKENLFNGEYFIQKVDLANKGYTEHFDCPQYWNDEKGELKYQIGEGCEIDQILAQWHANLCGLGDIFDKEQRITALKTMYKNIVKGSMREFVNAWRVFVINDEKGAIMCDYPEGATRPIIPIPYADECMTGFEYSFAGLLISEGFVEEGLEVVRAVRNRYDGEKRNPYNEIECGSNYARAMASFALLPIFSGFDFDVPKLHIGFTPIYKNNFNCFFSLQSAWGNFVQKADYSEIEIKEGKLPLKSVKLGNIEKVKRVIADGKEINFTSADNTVYFDKITVNKSIRFEI